MENILDESFEEEDSVPEMRKQENSLIPKIPGISGIREESEIQNERSDDH